MNRDAGRLLVAGGAALATLIVVIALLGGPAIMRCTGAPEGMLACLRGSIVAAGLMPGVEPQGATTPEGVTASAADVDVATPVPGDVATPIPPQESPPPVAGAESSTQSPEVAPTGAEPTAATEVAGEVAAETPIVPDTGTAIEVLPPAAEQPLEATSDAATEAAAQTGVEATQPLEAPSERAPDVAAQAGVEVTPPPPAGALADVSSATTPAEPQLAEELVADAPPNEQLIPVPADDVVSPVLGPDAPKTPTASAGETLGTAVDPVVASAVPSPPTVAIDTPLGAPTTEQVPTTLAGSDRPIGVGAAVPLPRAAPVMTTATIAPATLPVAPVPKPRPTVTSSETEAPATPVAPSPALPPAILPETVQALPDPVQTRPAQTVPNPLAPGTLTHTGTIAPFETAPAADPDTPPVPPASSVPSNTGATTPAPVSGQPVPARVAEQVAGAEARPQAPTLAGSPPVAPRINASELATVTVVPGDTLWGISRTNYGEGRKYPIIYRANTDVIRNPHWIYPGQVLVLPEDE